MRVAATLNRVIYLDGSALCRFLPGVRHHAEWGAWAQSRIADLVTTQLGFTELRQAAELYPRRSIEKINEIVDTVRAGVNVIQFSDDNVTISSHATVVLKPFAALHLGAAASHANVDTIATYDPALASVARLYDLKVVSPGLPDDWYQQYDGPPEEWKPIALDAPREPGVEFEVPDVAPKPDIYMEALKAAEAESAPPVEDTDEEEAKDEDAVDATDGDATDGDDPNEDEPDEDEPDEDRPDEDRPDEDKSDEDKPIDGEKVEAAPVESPPAEPEPAGTNDQGDAGNGEPIVVEPEMSEFDRALHEAEAAAIAQGEPDALDDEAEDGREDIAADGGDAAAQERPGTYRPRVEAWRGPAKEGEDPELESGDDEPVGDGRPWSKLPETRAPTPAPPTPPAAPSDAARRASDAARRASDAARRASDAARRASDAARRASDAADSRPRIERRRRDGRRSHARITSRVGSPVACRRRLHSDDPP